MSRLLIAASLITAFCSFASHASARAVVVKSPTSVRWAQPPASDVPDYRVAPHRVLDRAAVRAQLVANRAANLARFRAYQKAGVFPSNTYSDGKLNVWLDEDGHLCAAATIIKASGQADLVARTADQNNFIRLADVTQGPLMDWILMSGLTQAEIVAIQEPMMNVYEPSPEPEPVRTVDARLRKIEDRRLIAKYRQVDAAIVKNQAASLDAATDRIMKRADLGWQLLGN